MTPAITPGPDRRDGIPGRRASDRPCSCRGLLRRAWRQGDTQFALAAAATALAAIAVSVVLWALFIRAVVAWFLP